MSQENPTRKVKETAESSYRNAFDRLKSGDTLVLPRGAPVSQNNVAKEAGSDPSALRKSRFPTLVAQIQNYISENQPVTSNKSQKALAHRKRNRNIQERLEDALRERDQLSTMLNLANTKILELNERLTELEAKIPASIVIPLRPNHTK